MKVTLYFPPLFKKILLFRAHHYMFNLYLILLRSNNLIVCYFYNNFDFLRNMVNTELSQLVNTRGIYFSKYKKFSHLLIFKIFLDNRVSVLFSFISVYIHVNERAKLILWVTGD